MLYGLIGLLSGIIFTYIILKPQIVERQEINHEVELTNQNLIHQKTELETALGLMQTNSNELLEKNNLLTQQYEANKQLYKHQIDEYKDAYMSEYHQLLAESADEFNNRYKAQVERINVLESNITDLQTKVNAAVQANIRAQEMKEQANFYRLTLSKVELEEIKKLREVEPYLRDATPLNKVIWKVYYEHPFTDMIGRVIGADSKTGIYKITNLENGMCYIGQAADFARRWKQHVMCGIGADKQTNNKLYPAMQEFGVENFTFEIVEECKREQLNEREQYWQEYFQARTYGYSIK